MVQRAVSAISLSILLAGCGGNPFIEETDTTVENPVTQLPGTEDPDSDGSIVRYEAQDDSSGNGYAQNITYDETADTFSVDNLGFDGENLYERGTAVASIGTTAGTGPYKVYEASKTVIDPYSGDTIPQFLHRLVYGKSDSGMTEFAIVRTGAYTDYGFGGFVMRRDGGVVLPTSGQAGIYDGDYAGLIDYNGTNGLRYATGEAHVAIDFNDFNDGDAVQGTISNRRVFNMAGVDITDQVLAQINTEYARGDLDHLGEDLTEIPTLVFRVGPGAIDANGEIRGILDNTLLSRESGSNVNYETGNYYAIVAGPNAEELVGIIVVESSLPGAGNITARETGGFIAYR